MADCRYAQTVAPTLLPLTVDEAAEHCSVNCEDHLGYLRSLIAKATRYVERISERQLLRATWTLTMDSFPEEIELRKLPVAAVSSIVYINDDNVATTLTAITDYQVDTGWPDSPARIMPAYGCTWPSTRSDTYNAVVVTFTAGWATAVAIPEGYRQAVLMLVGFWFETREPVNVGNIVNEIPLTVRSLLAAESWGSYA